MTNRSLTALSAARRKLAQAIRRLHYGQILGLTLRNGEPIFDPAPQIVHDIKLASDSVPRPALRSADTPLNRQFQELFDVFDRLDSGVIDVIEVKAGQPFRVLHTQSLT